MRVITLDSNNTVISVKTVGDAYAMQSGDLVSDSGDIGQVQQQDGTFTTPEAIVPPEVPTQEDKINYLYYKSMGVIS